MSNFLACFRRIWAVYKSGILLLLYYFLNSILQGTFLSSGRVMPLTHCQDLGEGSVGSGVQAVVLEGPVFKFWNSAAS